MCRVFAPNIVNLGEWLIIYKLRIGSMVSFLATAEQSKNDEITLKGRIYALNN
jgi:hypothetical protein